MNGGATFVEWRVVTTHGRAGAIDRPCATEPEAREWARLERLDYPHAEVVVQRREVTTWEDQA